MVFNFGTCDALHDEAENNEPHKRERENIIDNDAEDVCSSADDTQCALFLGSLKQCGQSYVLEDNKSDVPLLIEYEVETSSEDERETERRRKMGSGVEQRTDDLGQNQCGYDVQVLSSRERNVDTVVPLDNALVSQNCGARINQKLSRTTENLCECVDGARTHDKDKIVYQRKVSKVVKDMNVVKGGHEAIKKAVVQIENRDIYQNPGPSDNLVTKNQRENVDQVRLGEKDKVQSQVNLPKKLVKRKNVVRGDLEVNTRSVVQKPGSNQARLDKKDDVQTPRKLTKVDVKGKNMVEGDIGANQGVVVKIEKGCQYQKLVPRNDMVTKNHEHVDRPCKKDEVQTRRQLRKVVDKGKNVVKGEVKKEEVQGQRKLMKVVKEENVVRGDNGLSNQKTAFGTSKNQIDCNVQSRSGRKSINENFRKTKAANVNREKEGDDESASEVEILDSAAFQTRGVLSSFLPSNRFDKSDDDSEDLGGPSASDEFRKRVLEVLKKPYDKEEHNRLREAVRGSYLKHYPDLGKKLKKHRYNRRKCLAILRGFFFWLQNVVQEGSFRPWKDGQCLRVEPPSP